MRKLTKAELRAECLEIAQAAPRGKRNPMDESSGIGCRYFDVDGMPSCLFGNVFARHGVKPSQVREYDDITKQRPASALFDGDAFAWADVVQALADQGATWRQAIRAAGR